MALASRPGERWQIGQGSVNFVHPRAHDPVVLWRCMKVLAPLAHCRRPLVAVALLALAACCKRAPQAEPAAPLPLAAVTSVATAQPSIGAAPAPTPQTDPVAAQAALLAARAASVEPAVTPLLVELAATLGGSTYKLDFRLKTKASIIRKIHLRLAEDSTLKLSDIVIDDTLRFTLRFDDEPAGHHVAAIQQALAALEAQGHQVVRLKNYWPADDNYSAVNGVLRAPGGLLWELQFHTSESLQAAATTRAWYEELRRSDTLLPRRRELFDEMTREWNKVTIPQGILEPGALHPHEEIRERPRP